MIKVLAEIGWTHKISFTAIGATITNSLADSISWANANMLSMSAAATFFLTITMIVSYICDQIRKNRSSKIELAKQELEIEKLRRELGGK